MAARRCSLCGINYPTGGEFIKCPVHTGEDTTFVSDLQPDENWDWRATALLHQVRPGPESPIPYLRDVPVNLHSGQLFISGHDVIRAGRRDPLRAGDIIELEHELKTRQYSVLYEVMGRRESTREYWIRRVVIDPHEAGVTA